MSALCCPHCGEPAFPLEEVEYGGCYLAPDNVTIRKPNGEEVYIERKSCRTVLNLLMRAKGRLVRKDAAMATLYGTRESEPGWKVIDVFMSQLRRQLKENEVPLRIKTVWGEGWCLEVNE